MTYATAYWVCLLIYLVLGMWSNWPANRAGWRPMGGSILIFLLFLLIGLAEFGDAIHR